MSEKNPAETGSNTEPEGLWHRFKMWFLRTEPAALAVYLAAEDIALLRKTTQLSQEEQTRIVDIMRRAEGKRSDHLAPGSKGRMLLIIFIAFVAAIVPVLLAWSLKREGEVMTLILAIITGVIGLLLLLDRIIIKSNPQNYELVTLFIVIFGITSGVMGLAVLQAK